MPQYYAFDCAKSAKSSLKGKENWLGSVKFTCMPTVLELQGFKFHFYSDEGNEPAHIHIKKGEARGKWWLEPDLEEEYAYGFTLQERRQVKKIIHEHSEILKHKWHEYFQR